MCVSLLSKIKECETTKKQAQGNEKQLCLLIKQSHSIAFNISIKT